MNSYPFVEEPQKSIFDNIIKLKLSEYVACHLYELLKDEIVNCHSMNTIKVYMPALEKLESQIRKQMVSESYLF